MAIGTSSTPTLAEPASTPRTSSSSSTNAIQGDVEIPAKKSKNLCAADAHNKFFTFYETASNSFC